MKVQPIHILPVLLAILLTLSCKNERMKVPEGMLQPDEMVPLLVDLHLADGYLHNLKITQFQKKDSAFFIYPDILAKYNVTRPMLDSTILFYGQYPKEFVKIYDKVLEELSRMEGKARELDTLPQSTRTIE